MISAELRQRATRNIGPVGRPKAMHYWPRKTKALLMTLFVNFIWIFLVGVPAVLILLSVVGIFSRNSDEEKAIRYLAKKHDEEAEKKK